MSARVNIWPLNFVVFMRVKQEAELRRRCVFGSVSVTSLSVNPSLLLPGEMDDYREYRSAVASALHRDIHQREYHKEDAVAVVSFTPWSVLRFINVVESCCQTC